MPFPLPVSVQPLSLEDRTEMARDRVGLASWEELEPAEQGKLIERCIWKADVYEAWVAERVAEEAKRQAKLRGGKVPAGMRRRKGAASEEDEEED